MTVNTLADAAYGSLVNVVTQTTLEQRIRAIYRRAEAYIAKHAPSGNDPKWVYDLSERMLFLIDMLDETSTISKMELNDVEPNTYSDLCVMQSAAGYYVGTYFRDTEFGDYLVPGSRDSGYFATTQEAHSYLSYLNITAA